MSIFLRQRWRFEGNLRKLDVNFSLSAFSSNETAALFSQVWEAWLGRLAIRGQGLMGKDGRIMMDPSWRDSPKRQLLRVFPTTWPWRPWRWSFKHPNLDPWHHLLFAIRLMFEMNCVRLVKVAKLDTWCSFLLKATWLALISVYVSLRDSKTSWTFSGYDTKIWSVCRDWIIAFHLIGFGNFIKPWILSITGGCFQRRVRPGHSHFAGLFFSNMFPMTLCS